MDLFSEQDQERISDAIELAENQTSGEIRVCVSKHCPGDILEQATYYFEKMGMHKTALRTGVLFYLAMEDRKFAIVGDQGIHEKVPEDFWDTSKNIMQTHFKQGAFIEGLLAGIASVTTPLKHYFPRVQDDVNELPNDIVQF